MPNASNDQTTMPGKDRNFGTGQSGSKVDSPDQKSTTPEKGIDENVAVTTPGKSDQSSTSKQ